MVQKSGCLTYGRDFLAVFLARNAEPAGIILKLRLNYGIIRLEVGRNDSLKCIWEIPFRDGYLILGVLPNAMRILMNGYIYCKEGEILWLENWSI